MTNTVQAKFALFDERHGKHLDTLKALEVKIGLKHTEYDDHLLTKVQYT